MARKRWIVRVKDAAAKPVFYHCISRVVDRRFAFGREEKEKFRTMMRMMEKFSGCRIVSYCLMCNHIHLLVEVPPAPVGGISDAELLERLRAIYHEAFVAEVAMELKKARRDVADGRALGVPSGMDAAVTGRDGAGRDGSSDPAVPRGRHQRSRGRGDPARSRLVSHRADRASRRCRSARRTG